MTDGLRRPIPAGVVQATPAIVRATRLIRLLAHLLRGLLIVTLRFPFANAAQQQGHVRRWSQQLLRILAIEVEVRGAPNDAPVLVVANHVSWLDIFVLDSLRALSFVSKSEVAGWPLIGRLATAAGTLYIKRQSRHAVRGIIEAAAAVLRSGHSVGIFPEGTTGEGHEVGPFHASLFAAALESGAAVQPAAVAYLSETGERARHTVYSGDTTLLESMLRIIAARRTIAVLIFAPPIAPEAHTRRELASLSRDAVRDALMQV